MATSSERSSVLPTDQFDLLLSTLIGHPKMRKKAAETRRRNAAKRAKKGGRA